MHDAVTVLMYHAIGDEQGVCAGADRDYAVSSRQFDTHLRLAQAAGRQVRSVADLMRQPALAATSVAFTFDDGHDTNGPAAERLAREGFSADFFVNPANVGQRHYLDWSDLRQMSEAGMSIQSHGLDHRYLDDLAPAEVDRQLVQSRREIEDHIGRPVTIFAPPGGRVVPAMAEVARRAGYHAVCTSRVGLWRVSDGAWDVARLPVMLGTPEAQLARWIAQDPWELANRRARHAMLSSAKRLLGNRRYDQLRSRLMRTAA